MNVSFITFLAIITAFVFFGIIPGVGAFLVRSDWRRFRIRMYKALTMPFLDYSDLKNTNEGAFFRFFGNLEAIQGKNKIWIKSGNISIAADLEKAPVYILPSMLTDEEAQSIPWKRISSLAAGTQFLIAGSIHLENGGGIFRSCPGYPLLIVIYDGDKETILKRAIRGGRHKNEYWNHFTIISHITGSFSMLLLAYLFFRNPVLSFSALISLALSFSPLIPLLPPGVIFFFLYQYYWGKARFLRADRDLIRLPLYHFKITETIEDLPQGQATYLPDGEKYIMMKAGPSAKIENILSQIPEIDIRRSFVLKQSKMEQEFYLFGAYSEKQKAVIKPTDPMAELVLIPGNPEHLARECNKKANFFTLMASIFILLAIIPNFYLIIYILHYFIR